MSGERTRVAVALTEQLRAAPDPKPDLFTAETELWTRIHRAALRARLAKAAVLVAVVLVALTLLLSLNGTASPPPPAKHLKSGLPLGTLVGFVVDSGKHSVSPQGWPDMRFAPGPNRFYLTVHGDGTGLESPTGYHGPLVPGFPVRLVGSAPGRVMIIRPDPSCGNVTDLVLDIVPHGDGVMITKATRGRCSLWPAYSMPELVGVTLRPE